MNVKIEMNVLNVKYIYLNDDFKFVICKFNQKPMNEGKKNKENLEIIQFIFIWSIWSIFRMV